MATVTRDDLAQAVAEEAGLTRRDARRLVDTVIEEIAARLEAGEAVKISSFGSLNLRDKGERLGRNPLTLESALITPRRVVTFRASHVLKKQIDKALSGSSEGS